MRRSLNLRRFGTAWRQLVGGHPRRVLNAGLVVLQKRLRPLRAFAMPVHYGIEVTNLCHGGCRLCPVGEGRQGRPLGSMSWEHFGRVVDQVEDYATLICLYAWGEPFEHPRLFDMIRHIKDRGIYVKVSTNTHPFRLEDAERLVASGLDELAVSLHGASEATYRLYQPQYSLAEVLEKTRGIVAAKERLKSRTPAIHFNFVVLKQNEHEIEDLRRLAASLSVGCQLVQTSLHLRLLPYDLQMNPRDVSEEELRQERLRRIGEWLPQDNRQILQGYQYIREHDGRLPPPSLQPGCPMPWYLTVISWNGDVNLCSGIFSSRHSIGNIFEAPLKTIWNNDLCRAARKSLRDRQPGDTPAPCGQCGGILL
jgi:radical SAM protein with 4Fe4S-binding SPASM domain